MKWGDKPLEERKGDIDRAISSGARSASELAESIGVSRNSIIGFMYRHKIPYPSKPKRKPSTPYSRRAKRPPSLVWRRKEKFAPVPAIPEPQPVAGKPLIDLLANECHWPVWNELSTPPSQSLYCGEHTDRPHGYCDYHRRRGTRRVAEIGEMNE